MNSFDSSSSASAALRLRPFEQLAAAEAEVGVLGLVTLAAFGVEVLLLVVSGVASPLSAFRLRFMPWNF